MTERTADTARARLAWILPFDRQAARRRRHDRRPIRSRDYEHIRNVMLARMLDGMARRLFGGFRDAQTSVAERNDDFLGTGEP